MSREQSTESTHAKEYEKLRREHGKLEHQLVELEARRWLSAADEAEIKRLKREKLARKDRMRAIQPATQQEA
jgi:uncharacterized protein YdcH (DUF465 family)